MGRLSNEKRIGSDGSLEAALAPLVAHAPRTIALANKARNMIWSRYVARRDSRTPGVELNDGQRLAVEHGLSSGPLLVIAGAGSGKTAMLAHRVAALILAGADPKRIMLATFSRRAAAELSGASSGCFAASLRPRRRPRPPRLFGHFPRHRRATFARICAAARPRPAIHHPRPRGFGGSDELGAPRGRPLRRPERFPAKATCLAIYSRVVNARGDLEATLGKWFPWVLRMTRCCGPLRGLR